MDDKTLNLLLDHYFEHEKGEELAKSAEKRINKADAHPFDVLAKRLYTEDGKFNNAIFNGLSKIIRLKEQKLRGSPRVYISSNVFVHKHKRRRRPLKARVFCVGINGLAIRTRGSKLAVNELVTVELLGSENVSPFYATCKVRYISQKSLWNNGHVVGLEFVRISKCAKRRLKGLLK